MRLFIFCLAAAVCIVSCKQKKEKQPEQLPPVQPKDTIITVEPPAENKDTVLLKLTDEVLLAFKNRDYTALAALVHPTEGVRFSPYAYIDSVADKIMTADWIKKQAAPGKQEKIIWGEYDPIGNKIKKTFDGYIKEFVYDVDFVKPEKRKVDAFIGSGNTQNNLLVMYDGCDFTESNFSGFEPRFDGMDWRSLRLVFKKKDGKYYLVGVVHDQWTT